jgi:hypothetical protein
MEGARVITLFHLLFKIIKWTVITTAYLLVGLAKLVTILVVLIFMVSRAGVRRLLDAPERKADDDELDQYHLGYPTQVARSFRGVSQDDFDARWQRERDLRVAERRALELEGGEARASTGRSEPRHYR